MLFTKPSRAQRFFYLLPFLLVMSRLPRRFVFSLLTHGSSCTCPQQLFVWLQKRFFLIQHGWAVKSGAVATLSTRSGQLAQLLTPTSTKTHTHTELHTHTLSTRREAKKAAQQEWWWGGETHILALSPSLCVFLSLFLAHILHLYLSSDAVASHTLHKWKQSSNKLQYEDLSINRDQYQLISGCLSFCVWMCLSQFKGQEIISSLKKKMEKNRNQILVQRRIKWLFLLLLINVSFVRWPKNKNKGLSWTSGLVSATTVLINIIDAFFALLYCSLSLSAC